MKCKIIGLTGTFASGKSTVIQIIRKTKGDKVAHYSTSDFVREETARRGLAQERENWHKVANEMRATKGAGVLGEIALQRAAALHASVEIVLVDSIRNPAEIAALRKAGGNNFEMWAIDAPIEQRYQRIKSRARGNEHILSFEEFKASEEKEMRGNATGQNIAECMRQADITINNGGANEELGKKVTSLLKR